MEGERPSLPEIPPDVIDPRGTVTPEHRVAQDLRQESPERLAQKIRLWWRGDAHTHTQESTRPEYGYPEGIYSEREILKYYEGLGLEFAVFTEHASKPGAPSVQSVDSPISQSLLHEAERITAMNREGGLQARGFSGVEANILFAEDGAPALDLPDEVLAKLDMVIASRHQILNEKEPAAIRASLLFAIQHPQVDVLGHPDRYATKYGNDVTPEYLEEYWAIWPEILSTMKAQDVAFEINFNNEPDQRLVTMAVEAGVPLFMNFDAHDFNQYKKTTDEIRDHQHSYKQRWATDRMQPGDEQFLADYKHDRLEHGPGTTPIRKLARWINFLESLGVTPDQVVNSSRQRLVQFLYQEHGRRTENLSLVAEADQVR